MPYISLAELEAGLPEIQRSPADAGRVELIVRRPAVDQREVLTEGILDLATGLDGDNWYLRPSIRTPGRSPHPDMQLTVMNARVAALVAGVAGVTGSRWSPGSGAAESPGSPGSAGSAVVVAAIDRRSLAGDQLFVDLDLSVTNLTAGSQLRLGSAIIEVTEQPHLGCAKFSARFGPDAIRFVNSSLGRRLRLRGLNSRVVQAGVVRCGDLVSKVTIPDRRVGS